MKFSDLEKIHEYLARITEAVETLAFTPAELEVREKRRELSLKTLPYVKRGY